ncbi:MAG: TlpA family protein disulfide reductase [Actinomycetia bacterium]|nr:TlpA family protein disulfide reductase [Actinomycetes bacterium]
MSTKQNRKRGSERREERVAEARLRTRNRRLMWAGIGVAIVALVVGLIALAPEPENAAVAGEQASTGEPAPAVEMVDFDGVDMTLAEYAGTPVVLNFWATWCPFCIAEMPDFQTVSQDTLGDVAFLGVNIQDDPTAAAAMATETGVTYRLTRDPQGVVYAAFGGIGMPTTVFVDADGMIRDVITGQMSESELRSKIVEHFSVDA